MSATLSNPRISRLVSVVASYTTSPAWGAPGGRNLGLRLKKFAMAMSHLR